MAARSPAAGEGMDVSTREDGLVVLYLEQVNRPCQIIGTGDDRNEACNFEAV